MHFGWGLCRSLSCSGPGHIHSPLPFDPVEASDADLEGRGRGVAQRQRPEEVALGGGGLQARHRLLKPAPPAGVSSSTLYRRVSLGKKFSAAPPDRDEWVSRVGRSGDRSSLSDLAVDSRSTCAHNRDSAFSSPGAPWGVPGGGDHRGGLGPPATAAAGSESGSPRLASSKDVRRNGSGPARRCRMRPVAQGAVRRRNHRVYITTRSLRACRTCTSKESDARRGAAHVDARRGDASKPGGDPRGLRPPAVKTGPE